MNAVIVLDVLSAANSSIYACSRTLTGLAQEGKAPRIFATTNSWGVPVWSLAVSIAIGCIAFLGTLFGDGVVFNYLVNILGISSLLTWMAINVTHIRFRIGWVKQGNSVNDLPYIASFFPFADILSLLIGFFVLGGIIYSAASSEFDPVWMSELYVGLPIFFGLYVVYAVLGYFRIGGCVWNGLVPYEKMDFETYRISWRPGMDDEQSEKAGLLKKFVDYVA
ncbi:hypothetical protein HDU93_004193 [Gonapodya sp. JEL0774]|nr:hypothetical protein HDU93_004193 [Gonapodya sp. JEL0774]